MKLFMCFGGAAAVADDEAASEAAAARHGDRPGRSLSFRARSFLSGKKCSSGKKKPSAASAKSKKRGMEDADDDVHGLFGSASSVASSVSLDSGYSSSSSSSSSSARSSNASSSSSPSVSGELFPLAAKRRWAAKKVSSSSSSPAAGAAAVVLCLLMVVLCGRVGATLLTSTALYLFPRRWPARAARGNDGVGSPVRDAEETAARRKVVTDRGFLLRNRKK